MKFDYPYIEDFGGTTKQFVKQLDEKRPNWNALNPSIGYSEEDGLICLLRASNYTLDENTGLIHVTVGSLVKNELHVCNLDENLDAYNIRKISFIDGPAVPRGVEDCRIFRRNGEWYFSGVILEKAHTQYARLAVYKLDLEKAEATFVKKYNGPEIYKAEKNWMSAYDEANPNWEFIYGATSIYKNDTVIAKANIDEAIASIRGGSSLWPLGDGTYLAVTHSVYVRKVTFYDDRTFGMVQGGVRNYTHQFVRYDYYGKILEASEEFIFDAPGVEFAAGLIEHEGNFIVSYGRKDVSAHLAIIPKQNVLDMLQPVGEYEDDAWSF